MNQSIRLFSIVTFWSITSLATSGSIIHSSDSGALRIKLTGIEALALKNLMAPETSWEIADSSDSSTFSEIDCSLEEQCYLSVSGSIFDRSSLKDGTLEGSEYKEIRRTLKKAQPHDLVIEAPSMGTEGYGSTADVDYKLFTAIKKSNFGSVKKSTSDDEQTVTTAKINLGKLQIQCDNFSDDQLPTTCYFVGLFTDSRNK